MFEDIATLPRVGKEMIEANQGQVLGNEDFVNDPTIKKYYIESYGCAMNFSDSEIVASILNDIGYKHTKNLEFADLILVNTCSIREKAEETVRFRLVQFNQYKKKTIKRCFKPNFWRKNSV